MPSHALRLPAEWEKQTALMITWPHEYGLWGNMVADTEKVMVEVATITARYQSLIISCYDVAHQQHVKNLLSHLDPAVVHYFIVPSNDSWTRDHGPISVQIEGKTHLTKFSFNAWGGKYTYDLDNQIVPRLAQLGAFGHYPINTHDWILEGGSLDTDGQGTLLTTESCLLNPNRNPALTRTDIEKRLRKELGIDRVLWIKNSTLTGDDTDGHIDMLARFCDPNTICYNTPYPNSADWDSSSAMAAELKDFRTREGNPYRLIGLPAITPKFTTPGWRDEIEQMPASYMNFLIINGAVIVPVYNDPNDEFALACLQTCFPDRKIYSVNSLALIHQHGSIHCATMNIF